MRLLKYPLELRDERLNALASVDGRLLLLSSGGHVIVWSQKELVDTAFDRLSIDKLARKQMISVAFSASGPKGATGSAPDEAYFLAGAAETLLIGSEHELLRMQQWENEGARATDTLFKCTAPRAITDVKLDTASMTAFVLCSSPNTISLINVKTNTLIATITLTKPAKPSTIVLDPSGETFSVLCADRSIHVYQYNQKGDYKLLREMPRYVHVEPLHYKITMPPQANYLPVINSVKGTSFATSTSATVLLDRNKDYNVASTVVSPASNACKVLVFSPTVYEKTNTKKGTSVRYNLLATSGAKDGTILVWNTRRMKPLFNALQISETPINDMTWTDDGLTLYAVSNDNVLYTFAFLPVDLGTIVPESEVVAMRQKNKPLPPLVSKETTTTTATKEKTPTVKTEGAESTVINKGDTVSDGKSTTINNVTSLVKKVGKNKTQIVKTLASNPSVKVTEGTGMEFSAPSYNVPKDLKRRVQDESTKAGTPPTSKKSKRDLEPMDFLETGLLIPNASFSRIRLASPKIRLSFKYSSPLNKTLTMTVKNGSGNEQKPTVVSLQLKNNEQDEQLFQDFIPKFITMCTAGKFFWACCSDDGVLYVYSDSGKKLLPPMIMGTPISFLEANGNFLLCVTSIGELYCWDIEKQKLEFPSNSVYPVLNPSLRYSDDILTRAENITMCTITAKGVPLLTLSNGDGYMFDKLMETWLLITDSWWAYGSQYWDSTNSSILNKTSADNNDKGNDFWNSSDVQDIVTDVKGNSNSIVNYMERKTNEELNRKGRIKNLQRFARAILMKEGYESMEEIVTLAHLENRLLVCLKLEESEEFSKLLIVYCVRLSKLGYGDRLDDVLQWLYNEGDLDNKDLGSKDRKDLLKSVLLACANIRHVQRITNSYATAIGLVNDSI